MKIGRPDEMAWDGRSETLAVLTRWALLDSPSAGPCRSWFVWRQVTQGGVSEGVPVLPCEGRSVRRSYLRMGVIANCINMKAVRMRNIHLFRWRKRRECPILSYSAEVNFMYEGATGYVCG